MEFGITVQSASSANFPGFSPALERFGLKFTGGGAHISRTMMLKELEAVFLAVADGASAEDYRDAILNRNVLSKSTNSTRAKSVRHLRELYGMDLSCPIFSLLRKMYELAPASLPHLAVQVAWGRDPLFRATTMPVWEAKEGERVETVSLARALDANLPGQYSELNCGKIARNAASSWTQAGHLIGRGNKVRAKVKPSPVPVTLSLILGTAAGYHGSAVFSNPWCRLLDLTADGARAKALEAHRAGFLDLRAIGEVVEVRFPLFEGFLSVTK